jgi:hypothetical protein
MAASFREICPLLFVSALFHMALQSDSDAAIAGEANKRAIAIVVALGNSNGQNISLGRLDSRDVRSTLVTIGAPIKPSNSEHAPLTRLPEPAAICRKDGCWTHRLMATTCRLMMGRKGTFTL